MNAVLVVEYCSTCQTETDQELNARALETECLTCKKVESVSSHYAMRAMEE